MNGQEIILCVSAVVLGAGSKLAREAESKRKKVTMVQIISTMMASMLIGLIVYALCTYFKVTIWLQIAFLALGSLLSEKLIGWLFRNNAEIFRSFLTWLTNQLPPIKNEKSQEK